jgi:urea transport system substrate-binding protein
MKPVGHKVFHRCRAQSDAQKTTEVAQTPRCGGALCQGGTSVRSLTQIRAGYRGAWGRRRAAALAVLAAIGLLGATACSPSPGASQPSSAGSSQAAPAASPTAASAAQGKVQIGIIVGLSGANSVVAPSVVQAAELAVEELNKKGGILGKSVEMQVFDDGSGPDGALKAFNTAIQDKKVDVIVAMETSSARNAGAPIANRASVPFIYTSPYEGGDCKKYLFANTLVPPQLIDPGLVYMKDSGAKTWFLLGSDYAYGRFALEAARNSITGFGGTVVGEEYNPVDAADWAPILSKIRSANPSAVVTATAGGAPNVSLLKQYRDAGLTAPVISLSLDEGTAKTIGSAAEGVILTSDYFTSLETAENKAFLTAMKAKFGDKMETPNFLSVPTYDGIHAYALAAAKAGAVTSDAIIAALPEVSFTGPRGPVRIDQQHHAALSVSVGQVQGDGSIKILKNLGLIDSGNQCPDLK